MRKSIIATFAFSTDDDDDKPDAEHTYRTSDADWDPDEPAEPEPPFDISNRKFIDCSLSGSDFGIGVVSNHSNHPTKSLRLLLLKTQVCKLASAFQEPQRRMNSLKTKILLNWIPQELATDLIEPGQLGDYRSPLNLVQHFDKEKIPITGWFLACLDATRVNKPFAKIPIRIPFIDLKWAFHHLPLKPDQQKFFGFVTPLGAFRYKRAPFGFLNSPSNQEFFISTKVDRPFLLSCKNLIRFIASWWHPPGCNDVR